MENENAHLLRVESTYRNQPHIAQVDMWNYYASIAGKDQMDYTQHVYATHTLAEIEEMLITLEKQKPDIFS